MDYQKISEITQKSLVTAMRSASNSQASQEQLAQVISTGIVAALREYDDQKHA